MKIFQECGQSIRKTRVKRDVAMFAGVLQNDSEIYRLKV